MEWYVFYHNFNGRRIEKYNIFEHGGFRKDVVNYLKKYEERVEFAVALKRSLMFYFWSKSEWELLVSPWSGGVKVKAIKIDVYDQVMLNWDVFVDYVWSKKGGKGG